MHSSLYAQCVACWVSVVVKKSRTLRGVMARSPVPVAQREREGETEREQGEGQGERERNDVSVFVVVALRLERRFPDYLGPSHGKLRVTKSPPPLFEVVESERERANQSMSGSMLSPRSSHRLGSAALRRSSPGYVGSRRQVAPLSLDIIEQDAESLAAAALKREWLAIRRKEHQESLRRRSCLASPRNPSLLISEVEDSFSGPPQPPLPSRDQWLATNSETRSGSETRGARRDSRRDVTEARAIHALRQPVKAVPDRSLHPSSSDLERKAKHQWLAQTRTAWESQRGQSARARSGSCLHPLLYRLALGARTALWAGKRAIAAWTQNLGCGGALVPGNSRRFRYRWLSRRVSCGCSGGICSMTRHSRRPNKSAHCYLEYCRGGAICLRAPLQPMARRPAGVHRVAAGCRRSQPGGIRLQACVHCVT